MIDPITCRCGASWTGENRSHCAAKNCHHTFGGVTSFDAHRRNGKCIHPSLLGLRQNAKGIWVAEYGGN